jgi:hypothetical protein
MKSLRFAFALAVAALVVAGAVRAAPTAGRAWTVAESPNPGGWGNIVWDLSALSERDAWAVGVQATHTSNDPLALHWDGTSWSSVQVPTPAPNCEDGNIQWTGNSLNAVDGVSAGDVWAVGATCYGMDTLAEHWNGSSWSIVAGPNPPGGAWATLYGVEAISSSNAWAVGYESSDVYEPLVEHWDGHNWSIVNSPAVADGYLGGVAATGPNDVWAVGGSDAGPVVEHFDGSSWSLVSVPQPAGGYLGAVTALSPANVWAVGSQGVSAKRTLVMHYDGKTWRVVPSPNPSEAYDADNDLRGLAAVGPSDIWAVGMYQNEHTSIHQHRTLIEHWNGTSWNIVSSPSPGHSSELNAAAVATRRAGPLSTPRVFAAGLYSNYDINIYDGTYTLPQTLVMDTR